MPGASVIEMEHVTTRLESRVIHRDVSLGVAAGEIVGLVGQSGSGKTTLMREMIGLLEPEAGQVFLFGQPLFPARQDRGQLLRERVGVLFQGGALFSALDVYDNIAFPLRENGTGEGLVHELVRMLLDLVGLSGSAAHLYPAELSAGMVTRAGLAPVSGEEFVELLRSLQRDLGFSVFMITHDLMTLRDLCHRVAVLADQHLVAYGPLAEVITCPHPFVASFFQGTRGRQVLQPGR
jgi:phospholipid/cholesterol/gamma-HCH transport system ATP-binding protein